MTLGRFARRFAAAAVAGVVFGVTLSGNEVISVRVWLIGSAVVFVTMLVRDVLVAADVERATMVPAWRLVEPDPVDDATPMVRSIASALTAAQDNAGIHRQHLRPRLTALATHYLPVRHGLDPARHPSRAAALLGDVGWLIDPAVGDRTPTATEIARFLDIVIPHDVATEQVDASG